ncbi:hypothetical protein ACEWY4_018366 [Coilia grayii]|uniref:DUF4806 domain-containing protein n=1 Tax=Coilia grayii TaxID=363190 RepID=A0ABD1JJJ8_9TELE
MMWVHFFQMDHNFNSSVKAVHKSLPVRHHSPQPPCLYHHYHSSQPPCIYHHHHSSQHHHSSHLYRSTDPAMKVILATLYLVPGFGLLITIITFSLFAVLSNQAASPLLETSHLFLTSNHGEFTSQAPQPSTTLSLPPLPQLSTTLPLPPPPQLPPVSQHPSSHEDFCRLVLQHLLRIEEEVKEVKEQVATNTAILQKLGGGVGADLCLAHETNMPLSNLEELEELERQLGSDLDLKNQLVNILAVVGGKTTKDAVKRMLGRSLKKSLALKINWTGAGGKVAFKSLQLKNVLHRAVRRVVHTATEEELQKEVATYLKGAADREGGRKDRQKKVGYGEIVCESL